MTVVPEKAGLEEETGEKGLCGQNLLFTLISRCKQKHSQAKLTLAPRQHLLRAALLRGQQTFTLFLSLWACVGCPRSGQGDSDVGAGAHLWLPGRCRQVVFWCEGRRAQEHAACASAEAQVPACLPRLGKGCTARQGRDGSAAVALACRRWRFSWLREPFVSTI